MGKARDRQAMVEQVNTSAVAPVTLEPEVKTETIKGDERPKEHVPFGSRYLTQDDDVYSHNAWDHVVPPPEWKVQAKETLQVQRSGKVSDQMKWAYNSKPSLYWNRFYDINKEKFFKDRNWLRLEFPELLECAKADAGPKLVVEIGCGAGNTVFPLLSKNENPELVVHACDYSQSAVNLVKANPMYPVPPHGNGILHSSVWDVTTPMSHTTHSSTSNTSASDNVESNEASSMQHQDSDAQGSTKQATGSLPEGVEPGTVDIAVMIFVMSALHPTEWQRAIANAYRVCHEPARVWYASYSPLPAPADKTSNALQPL